MFFRSEWIAAMEIVKEKLQKLQKDEDKAALGMLPNDKSTDKGVTPAVEQKVIYRDVHVDVGFNFTCTCTFI